MVLHIETMRGVPHIVATALESLGYRFEPSMDVRNNSAHRFVRGATTVDLVAGAIDEQVEEQVDVLIADHPAPRVIETLRGHEMVRIEGGTQALRRTVNARLQILPGRTATISVPRPFGALILKAAAYTTDSRDRDRHLFDAAALLACVGDPFAERAELAGSDRRRISTLVNRLTADHPAWRALPEEPRTQAAADPGHPLQRRQGARPVRTEPWHGVAPHREALRCQDFRPRSAITGPEKSAIPSMKPKSYQFPLLSTS